MKIAVQSLLPAARPKGNWADRFGPLVISMCLHAIAACLIFTGVVTQRNSERKTLRINLVKAFPRVPPAPSLPTSPPPPARANAPGQALSEAAASASPQQPVEGAAEPASAPAIQSGERIQRILSEYGARMQAGNQAVLGERKDLQYRLKVATMQASAAPHFPSYDGARVGAIRTLTLDNVDLATAQEVMARYDIRITSGRFMQQSGLSYLNSAASRGSVFTPQQAPGVYDVFEISPKAYQRMVVLEHNWLVSRGYNPRETRVDTVEFGIVRKGSVFDLGILKMQVQSLTEIGKPSYEPGPPEGLPPSMPPQPPVP